MHNVLVRCKESFSFIRKVLFQMYCGKQLAFQNLYPTQTSLSKIIFRRRPINCEISRPRNCFGTHLFICASKL